MAFLPAMIPLGVSLSKISRNSSDNGDRDKVPFNAYGNAIINRLITGGANAPITAWSEAKLEKAIARNSVFREHADTLRLARANALPSDYFTEGSARANVTNVDSPQTSVIRSGLTRKPTRKPTKSSAAPAAAPAIDGRKDGTVLDTLSEADLLELAAEGERKRTPARDAALELLADNSFDALLITDLDGNIAYSNKAFTKLTGYEQAEVIGKSPKLLQGPATDRKVLNRLKESMQRGKGDYEGSAINYKKDGTPFIMHWRVVPVKVGGEVKAWVAIQREGSQIPGEDLGNSGKVE